MGGEGGDGVSSFKTYAAQCHAVQVMANAYEQLAKHPPMHGQNIKSDLESIASNLQSICSQLYYDKPEEPNVTIKTPTADELEF